MRKTADFIEEANSLKGADASAKESKRGRHPKSLANLKAHAWPKGVSGNPGGKPKQDWGAILARAVIEGNLDAAYAGLSHQLNKGNAYTFKELCERGYGKLKETHQVTHVHEETADADLAERITSLERDLGLARTIDEAGRAGIAAAGTSKANGKAKDSPVLP
jgi:hypothetical protein